MNCLLHFLKKMKNKDDTAYPCKPGITLIPLQKYLRLSRDPFSLGSVLSQETTILLKNKS